MLLPHEVLHYRRTWQLDAIPPHMLLHFDAVDSEAVLTINGHEVGRHNGGYLPFFFDVAPYEIFTLLIDGVTAEKVDMLEG